jgi:hypothetical protein
MTRLISPSGTIEPAVPKTVQAGSVYTSGLDVDLATKVQTLWYNWAGTRHTWAWFHPNVAPRASVVTANTNYTLEFVDGAQDPEIELPWFQQKQFDTLEALVLVAHSSTKDLGLRMQTVTLIDAVSTVNSTFTPLSPVTVVPGQPSGIDSLVSSKWFQQETDYLFSWLTFKIEPALPASRHVAIQFVARWSPVSGDTSNLTTPTRDVRLVWVMARDTISSNSMLK